MCIMGIVICAFIAYADTSYDFSKMDSDFYSYLLRHFDKWGGVEEWTETEIYYDYKIGNWVQYEKKH